MPIYWLKLSQPCQIGVLTKMFNQFQHLLQFIHFVETTTHYRSLEVKYVKTFSSQVKYQKSTIAYFRHVCKHFIISEPLSILWIQSVITMSYSRTGYLINFKIYQVTNNPHWQMRRATSQCVARSCVLCAATPIIFIPLW